MRQAECASRDGRLPVVVLHQDRHRFGDAVCLIRLDDLAVLVDALTKRDRKAA